jgi:hypothetical protein
MQSQGVRFFGKSDTVLLRQPHPESPGLGGDGHSRSDDFKSSG